MASLIMHLAISNKLKEIYNFSDDFLVGAMAPDLLKIIYTKDKTHYTKEIQLDGEIIRFPDIDKFLSENIGKNDEYFLGYLSHLVQDKIWFGEYIPRIAKRLSRDETMYYKDKSVHSNDDATLDLYNDYAIVGEYILNKYDKVDIFKLKETMKYYFKNVIHIEMDDIVDNEKIIYKAPQGKSLILFSYNLTDDYIDYSVNECQKYIDSIIKNK